MIVKLMDRMAVVLGCRRGKWLRLKVDRVLVRGDEKVLWMDEGGGCPTWCKWMCLLPQIWTLKNGYDGRFYVVCVCVCFTIIKGGGDLLRGNPPCTEKGLVMHLIPFSDSAVFKDGDSCALLIFKALLCSAQHLSQVFKDIRYPVTVD